MFKLRGVSLCLQDQIILLGTLVGMQLGMHVCTCMTKYICAWPCMSYVHACSVHVHGSLSAGGRGMFLFFVGEKSVFMSAIGCSNSISTLATGVDPWVGYVCSSSNY